MQNVDLNISDSSTWNDSFESISEHFSSHSISYFLIEKNLSILPLFFMVFGTLGNSIAFYVLTRKKLRGQSTMLYFASLTVMDTLSLYQWNFNFFYKYQINALNENLENQSIFLCRYISFMANFSIQSSAWILAIITIDRYLIVSNRFNWKQKFSKNINFTLSVIVTVIGFFALINLPAALLNGKTAVLYNNASLSKYGLISRNRTECYNTDFYRLWQNITVLIECIFPLALMIIFNGLLINRTYKSSVKLDARHITRSSTILAETTTTVTPCQTSNSCTNLNHISSTAGKLRKNSVYNNFYFDPVTHLSKTKSKNLFQQYCSLSVIPPANAEEDDEVKEDFAKQYSKSQRRHSEAFESTSNCNGINNQMDTFIGNNRFLTPNNHKSSTNNLSMTSQMNLSKSFTSLAESKPVTIKSSGGKKNECADKPDRSWSKSRAGTPLNEEHAETSMLSKKTLKIPNGSNNKNMAISELENLEIKITKLNKTSSDQSSLREPSLVEFESITFSVPVISNKKI